VVIVINHRNWFPTKNKELATLFLVMLKTIENMQNNDK
jgi:hypothetical protein